LPSLCKLYGYYNTGFNIEFFPPEISIVALKKYHGSAVSFISRKRTAGCLGDPYSKIIAIAHRQAIFTFLTKNLVKSFFTPNHLISLNSYCKSWIQDCLYRILYWNQCSGTGVVWDINRKGNDYMIIYGAWDSII